MNNANYTKSSFSLWLFCKVVELWHANLEEWKRFKEYHPTFPGYFGFDVADPRSDYHTKAEIRNNLLLKEL